MLQSRSPEDGPAEYTSTLAFYLCVGFIETSLCFPFDLCDFFLHLTLVYYHLWNFLLVKTKVTYI